MNLFTRVLRISHMHFGRADRFFTDQQIGQLYELMNAIREKELSENDPEYEPPPRERD